MLQVIEHRGSRVLTTQQVAEAYEVDAKSLMRNFQCNASHFREGTHYISLTGEDLKRFKGERQNDATLKFVSSLYLWLEQGAFMLAKSLNSERAWQAYNMLTEQYYKITQQTQLPAAAEERIVQLEEQVQAIQKQLALITLHSGEQKRLQKAVTERVMQIAETSARKPAHYSAIYRAIKKRYNVASYRDVPQCLLQDALDFISHYGGGAQE
jgi:hypothetical protein